MEGEAVESGPVVEHVADLSTLRMKTWKHIFVEVDREAPAPLIFRSVERTRASAFWSMPSKRAASFEESPERATALSPGQTDASLGEHACRPGLVGP